MTADGKPVVTLTPLGERTLIVSVPGAEPAKLRPLLRRLDRRLRERPPVGFIEASVAYATLTVHYDPVLVADSRRWPRDRDPGRSLELHASDMSASSGAAEWLPQRLLLQAGESAPLVVLEGASPGRVLLEAARKVAAEVAAAWNERDEEETGRIVQIPVMYGGDCGPDLPDVARLHGLSEQEVVRLHSGALYEVAMIGFAPGFGYLDGLPPELATPRLAVPRLSLPAGAVGIGGLQTGVYPLASPGGWRWIGTTPLAMFDARRDPPSLLQAGDRVRFVPVDEGEEWPI